MKSRIFLIYCILLASWQAIDAETPPIRERININRDWRYQADDPPGTDSTLHYTRLKPYLLPCANEFFLFGSKYIRPEGNPGSDVAYVKPDFDDSGWRQLHLPHDWAIEGPFDIDLESATGKLPCWGTRWYRKTLNIPQADAGKQIYLDIDGAMAYASVWCNGYYVGGWPYGYASFRLDLTPYIKAGMANTLAVRLENPAESSRWYPGGGIYRNVWIVKTSPVHVSQWGTYVRNVKITPEEALMEISVRLENHTEKSATVAVQTQVYLSDERGKPTGEAVATVRNDKVVIRNGSSISNAVRFRVAKPLLWSLESPRRYVAVSHVSTKGKEIDCYHTPFGIRDAEFTLEDGFMLNGEKTPLKGVCMHHDLGALGTAFNTVAAERQLRIMKEMGVNAIRTSHNPPAPELVELCDRMGILMQLELGDAWHTPKLKNDYSLLFKDWSEADMRSLVRHFRNHPSVIMWSIGNEIPDQRTDIGAETARRLTAYCHDEDPTRPTTYACNHGNIGRFDIVNHVDVFGQNYQLKGYEKFLTSHPTRRYHASETSSAISSRGEYFFPVTTKPEDSQHNFQVSSYDVAPVRWGCTPEEEFAMLEKYPAMSGEFVWSGFDYLGESIPYNEDQTVLLNFNNAKDIERAKAELDALSKLKSPTRSSYFGIVDLCGFPKDRYYNYKSYWRPDIPTVHILPHWNWEERIGKVTPVHIYTSGDAVELFLNGVSQGRREKKHRYDRLTWNEVRYEPGTLKAVAYKNGKIWAETTTETTGNAAAIKVTPEKRTLKPDGTDLSFVRVEIVDAKGRRVPRANNHLKFSISGPVEIVATDNGNAADLTPFPQSERDAYNGMALVILRSMYQKKGKAILTVESKGLSKQKVELAVE